MEKLNELNGQDLFQVAKKIIPGGNMLLSKNPEMFLPDLWPAYFSKTQGCQVWDLEKKMYYDFSIMGIGTNTLGYNNPVVDESIQKVVKDGISSTLNCPEEVYLAQELINLNTWGQSVRFCRTGGEANSVAIRIARAASKGRTNVAVCGYHGWHDWYIALNLGEKQNLDELLLPGLEPLGVPNNLKNTIFPFKYNDLEGLRKTCLEQNIGVIKMEVYRNEAPENNFLQKVRQLCNELDIILIFDECTSGFRETEAGVYKNFNIEPDMVIYGKTLGNGYAITAILGKQNIMKFAEKTFISSTFWTERIGPTAGLATLKEMRRIKSWEIITTIGKRINSIWEKIFTDYQLGFKISGLPAITSFNLEKNDQLIQTYLTQEMLKKGFLFSNRFYASIAHEESLILNYKQNLEECFYELSKIDFDENQILNRLEGRIKRSGFKRLN